MSIPYDVDPSLHSGQPNEPRLDDGCSPPASERAADKPQAGTVPVPRQPALQDKSDF